jgi:hypothetical protein
MVDESGLGVEIGGWMAVVSNQIEPSRNSPRPSIIGNAPTYRKNGILLEKNEQLRDALRRLVDDAVHFRWLEPTLESEYNNHNTHTTQ